MYITIETERLLLRPIHSTDAQFIFELFNSKGWLEFIGDRNILDKSAAEEYILKLIERDNSYYNIFELKGRKKAIGTITFLHRDEELFPDIGFALLPDFENNGYTIEAASAYLEEIEKSKKFENIIALTMPTNKKSIRVINKLRLSYQFDSVKDGSKLSYFSKKMLVKPTSENK